MEPHEKWLKRERKSKSEGVSRREHPHPPAASRPHRAARVPAPAPCAVGPGSRLPAAAVAPAWPGALPFQTEAAGQAASEGTRWRSGSLAAGEGTSSKDWATGANPPATTHTC